MTLTIWWHNKEQPEVIELKENQKLYITQNRIAIYSNVYYNDKVIEIDIFKDTYIVY